MDRVNAQKKRRLRRVGAACPEWVEGRGISGLRAQASSAVGASASTVPHGGRERWGGTDPCRRKACRGSRRPRRWRTSSAVLGLQTRARTWRTGGGRRGRCRRLPHRGPLRRAGAAARLARRARAHRGPHPSSHSPCRSSTSNSPPATLLFPSARSGAGRGARGPDGSSSGGEALRMPAAGEAKLRIS